MSNEFAWMRGLRLTDEELIAYALLSTDPIIRQLAEIGSRHCDELYEKEQFYTANLEAAEEEIIRYKELYEKTVSEREHDLASELEKERRLSQLLMQQRNEIQDKLDHWSILSK